MIELTCEAEQTMTTTSRSSPQMLCPDQSVQEFAEFFRIVAYKVPVLGFVHKDGDQGFRT